MKSKCGLSIDPAILGYVLSVSTPNVHIAQQMVGATVTPFLILGGYFLDIR